MGMWEPESGMYKHHCTSNLTKNDAKIKCYEYTLSPPPYKLKLKVSIPQCCYEDEYEIEVKVCPFCGYSFKS